MLELFFIGYAIFAICNIISTAKKPRPRRRPQYPKRCSYFKTQDRYYKTGIWSLFE